MMQEADRPEKCYINTDSNSKSDNKYKPMITANESSKISYFLPGPNQDNDKRASTEITQQLQRDLRMYLPKLGALMEYFHYRLNQIQTIPGRPRHVAYFCQKPFKEELV